MTVNFSISVGKGIGPEYFDQTFFNEETKLLTVELSKFMLWDESFILRIVFVVVLEPVGFWTGDFLTPVVAEAPTPFLLAEFITTLQKTIYKLNNYGV